MLAKDVISRIIEQGCTLGANFVDVFVEHSESAGVGLLDRKIDQMQHHTSFGIGVRLLYGSQAYYGYSSDPDEAGLLELTRNLGQAHAQGQPTTANPLKRQTVDDRHVVVKHPNSVAAKERLDLLRQIDAYTREMGSDIRQVGAGVSEKSRQVLIANSEGRFVEDNRQYSRLHISAVADKGQGPQAGMESPGALGGYEFFEGLNIKELAESTASSALRMAGAGYVQGGAMPVVLGNGFGGVIFHEACGHPLETEAIRKNASPFAGKVGEKVAQPVLTAVDDGLLANHWGSVNVDDEGEPAQRTVLIENGVLQGYLSDRIGASQVGISRTGSARRENYRYAPVSRMRNTYIECGPHKVDEVIASVEEGLYAFKMGGGSVDPATGEFNFSVQEGYIIRHGKIAEPVRGATLIGKGYEVLPRISMIADDLAFAAGMCGASSGWVPTTVGQPTLKIDSILVGGR